MEKVKFVKNYPPIMDEETYKRGLKRLDQAVQEVREKEQSLQTYLTQP